MRCEDANWKLLLYLDGDLPPEESAALERHLLECETCAAELERLTSVQKAVDDALPDAEPSREAVGRIRSEVRRGRKVSERTRPFRFARALVIATLGAVLLSLTGVSLHAYLASLARSPLALELETSACLEDDGVFSVRVHARHASTGAPADSEPIEVSVGLSEDVAPTDTVSGRTDAEGLFHGLLRAPAASKTGSCTVSVRVGAGVAASDVARTVRVVASRTAHVWTDRSWVEPGGQVVAAGLLRRSGSGAPAADEPVTLEIADARGQVLYSRQIRTGEDGYVGRAVRLPDPAPDGPCTVTLRAEGAEASVPLELRAAGDSAVRVTLRPEREGCLPGDPLAVAVSAAYESGQPVSGASARLDLLDAEGLVSRRQALAGPDGVAAFRLRVPNRAPPGGSLRLEASVLDADLRGGAASTSIRVARPGLRVHVAPRGGAVLPGRSSVLDVLVLDPYSNPTPAELNGYIGGRSVSLATGPDGAAEVWAEAVGEGELLSGSIRATDDAGQEGVGRVNVTAGPSGALLVVPGEGACRVGDALAVDLSSDQDGLAYLDLQRDGVAVWGCGARLVNGEARVYVPIESGHQGALGLVARWAEDAGLGQGRAPCVFVDPASDLLLATERDVTAGASLTVTDRSGAPTAASVFAVSEVIAAPPPVVTSPDMGRLRLSAGARETMGDAIASDIARIVRARPSRSRRPSRMLLAAAGVDVTAPAVAKVAAEELSLSVVRRQLATVRWAAWSACGVLGVTFLLLLLGGELRVRGVRSLGADEEARRSIKALRTDLAVTGAFLLAASWGAGQTHLSLAARPAPAARSIVDAPSLTVPSELNPVRLAPPAPSGHSSLRPPEVALRTVAKADGRAELRVSGAAGDGCQLAALALDRLGRAGLLTTSAPGAPQPLCRLEIDPIGRIGTPAAGVVRVINQTAAAMTVDLSVTATGAGRVSPSGVQSLALGPRSEAAHHFRIESTGAGEIRIGARAKGEDLNWSDEAALAFLAASRPETAASGAALQAGDALERGPSPRGDGARLRLVVGREAIASQMLQAAAPPWLVLDEPVMAVLVCHRATRVFGGDRSADRTRRMLARERVRRAALALPAFRSEVGFGRVRGDEGDPVSTSLALLAAASARGLAPEMASVIGGCKDDLVRLCFERGASMSDAQRALAAWALAESGAGAEGVTPLLALAARAPESGAQPEPETLALATLAYAALGLDREARTAGDRLARALEQAPGAAASEFASVFGHTGAEADADVTALSALAFEAAPPGTASRPTRVWLIRRLAGLRQADGLFGGAVTNALCGLALMGLMNDPAGPVEVRVGVESGRETSVAPDQWLTLELSPEELREGALRVRATDGEPVQYLLLTPAATSPPLSATLTVTPTANPRVGDASLLATNGSGATARGLEVRAMLPPGLEPHAADLEEGLREGRVRGYTWREGRLRVLLDEMPAGATRTVSFRVRAARAPVVAESRERAELVPAGAAGG